MAERSVFRQDAVQAYERGRNKDVVPRLITWPIVACLWVLIGLFIAAGFVAWRVEIPTYVDGSGVLVSASKAGESGGDGTVAVLFLPPAQAAQVHEGLPVDIQIGSTGLHVPCEIEQVRPGVFSPDTVQASYGLSGPELAAITQPSGILVVKPYTSLPASQYSGSLITARVQTGSQRLLALLPGIQRLLGAGR